jgi:hypothetical protein
LRRCSRRRAAAADRPPADYSDDPTAGGWGSGERGGIGAGFYSQYVSYAYPGGASVKPINSVVVSPVVR